MVVADARPLVELGFNRSSSHPKTRSYMGSFASIRGAHVWLGRVIAAVTTEDINPSS